MQMPLFDLHSAKPQDPSPLAHSIRQFIAHCRVAKSLSLHTVRAYEGDLALFLRCLGSDVPPQDIGRDRIFQFIAWLRIERTLKETSVKRRLAALKIFFRWLEAEGIVAASVFHGIGLGIRSPKRLPRALDTHDMRRLLNAVDRSGCGIGLNDSDTRIMKAAVITLFTTGLRVSELISVRLNDLYLTDGSIVVRGKGNRERTVYLPSAGIKALEHYLVRRNRAAAEANLLISGCGRSVSARFVRSRLRAIAAGSGISRRVTPHMLRHTAATQLLDAGVDIRFVQRLLGHSSIATTQIYTQVTDSMLKMKLQDADTLGRVRRAG